MLGARAAAVASRMAETHPEPGRAGQNKRRLQIVLALTGTFLMAEVVGGVLTRSLALLADAGHMLTDVGGLVLALVGIRFAERPATPERTYGFHRAEILAALANAVALVCVSAYVLVEAYRRLRNPPAVASGPMMVVAALGLGINVAGILVMRAGAHESLNMRGAYYELLSDLLSSVAVVVAGAIMLGTGWYYADPILSAGIGVFILPRTWKLIREAVGVLLEGTPSDVNLTAVRAAIAGVPGVAGVHDLHVWSLTSGMNAASVHVICAGELPWSEVLRAVQRVLATGHNLHHVTIQVEPAGCQQDEVHL